MKKKLMPLLLLLVVVAMGAVFLGIGFAQGNPQSQSTEILTTQDIGARIPPEAGIKEASFAPILSKIDAIDNARAIVRDGMDLQDADRLPVKVTVAHFNGIRQIAPYDEVSNLPVRVVVFDDYPATTRGPRGSQDQFEKPRYTVILDDETGELVYSILSWSRKGTP